MRETTHQAIIERYRKLGGLSAVMKRYAADELTLQQIGDAIGYTKETVRNDIKSQIGESGLEDLKAQKREARLQTRRLYHERIVNISEAKEHIAGLMSEADERTRKELQALTQVLTEVEKAGIALTVRFTRHGATQFVLANETPVTIRVGIIDGSVKEHKYGIHRFKISQTASEREFTIFVLGYGDKAIFYVFAPSELSGLRSLNLRFTDESKYNIERKSKYDEARDNWKKLKRRKTFGSSYARPLSPAN